MQLRPYEHGYRERWTACFMHERGSGSFRVMPSKIALVEMALDDVSERRLEHLDGSTVTSWSVVSPVRHLKPDRFFSDDLLARTDVETATHETRHGADALSIDGVASLLVLCRLLELHPPQARPIDHSAAAVALWRVGTRLVERGAMLAEPPEPPLNDGWQWSHFFRRSMRGAQYFAVRGFTGGSGWSVRASDIDRFLDALSQPMCDAGPGNGFARSFYWSIPGGEAERAEHCLQSGFWVYGDVALLVLCKLLRVPPPRFASENARGQAELELLNFMTRTETSRID